MDKIFTIKLPKFKIIGPSYYHVVAEDIVKAILHISFWVSNPLAIWKIIDLITKYIN